MFRQANVLHHTLEIPHGKNEHPQMLCTHACIQVLIAEEALALSKLNYATLQTFEPDVPSCYKRENLSLRFQDLCKRAQLALIILWNADHDVGDMTIGGSRERA